MSGQAEDRLAHALRGAAADSFARVMEDDLASELRDALSTVLDRVEDRALREQLLRFQTGLERFEERGRQDRSRVVAHGLRICMALRLHDKAPSLPPKRAKTSLGVDRKKKQRDNGLELTQLPGIGPKTAAKLAARGIHGAEDLVFLLPLGYEDRRELSRLDEVPEGESALAEVVAVQYRQSYFRGRFSATMNVEQRLPDGVVVPVELRWFHRVGGLAKVEPGETLLIAGKVRRYRGRLTVAHPEVFDAEAGADAIAVRYPRVEGVGARTLVRACRAALDQMDAMGADPLPPELVEKHGLPGQREALEHLHRPAEDTDAVELAAMKARRSKAHLRLAFDEFFFLQLALLAQRASWRESPCRLVLAGDGFAPERLRATLPFEPTGAQWRVIREIESDMASGQPMLRLLQGDVGSGKTAVAFAAAAAVVASGSQAAIMAPTEILASQHAQTLTDWCMRAGIRLALLTGSTKRPQRASTVALLAAGQIDLLVGTHALIVEDVAFARLGLVVVDEQHRFGVGQRAALRDKGGAPHLLVMTATPIPRSLALTAFGELDVSIIDELPPGRQPAETSVLSGKRGLQRGRKILAEAVVSGRQAYLVCPLVEASEAVDASDVEASAQALRKLLPDHTVEVVHGRMRSADKDAAMAAFRSGEIDVLVATTVIEVGVDVPNASVILVEHAERFGLAQLHQLRGRVGRGSEASVCLLHTASGPDSEAAVRVGVMAETSDGFLVAERDLELRGPGEVFGRRQSGVPRLRFASFGPEGMKMLVAARDAAKTVLEQDPGLDRNRGLREELHRRLHDREVHSGESG